LESATKPGNPTTSGLWGGPGRHRNGESVLQLAHGYAAAGIALAARVHPDLCETDHHPAKPAPDERGFGAADPTVVLAQGHVQRVMPLMTLKVDPLSHCCVGGLFRSTTDCGAGKTNLPRPTGP
jgi:hypothetical protein